jgi:uncharacterized protein (TIGR00369 family)
MSATTEPAQALLERTRGAAHPSCAVCGRSDECGLGLNFRLQDDGSVEATFRCRRAHQGYTGMLHGGITSALLDGAMTNCLFAHGVAAVTGEMKVRFRHSIDLLRPVTVHGRLARWQPPLYVVEAEVLQDGRRKANAEGRFMERAEASL